MAIVNKVEKRVKVNRDNVIKFQISTSDLNCLTELAKRESIDLTNFCETISEQLIFKSPQSCRNAIQKAKRKDLVVKDGKKVMLNPQMKIQTTGDIFLDFKILGVD